MAASHSSRRLSVQWVAVLWVLAATFAGSEGGNGLSYDHYSSSCPTVEDVVHTTLQPIFLADPTAPAALLRLFFHDCQVQGCDASILLEDSDDAEIASDRNFAVRKQDAVGAVKSALEVDCPGQVSCADIVALAARESVAYSGGPRVAVPLGRKDSRSSSSRMADVHLPPAETTVDDMLHLFARMGMSLEESVAILGSHTLGVGHCRNIVARLYDPDVRGLANTDDGFELLLRLKCPAWVSLTNTSVFVSNDATSLLFDNQYYQDLSAGRGLFGVDAAMALDHRTAPAVRKFATDERHFFDTFASAFVKLSSAWVLTGDAGEIRGSCNRVNS